MHDLPKIPLTDEDYERFEEQIPALAELATREAYERALQSGFPVTILVGNSIVQVTANGDIKEIKKTTRSQKIYYPTAFHNRMSQTKRLRMFAGPNGSGKSTIKDVVATAYLGHYLNPDDIERQLKQEPVFDLSEYQSSELDESVVRSFFSTHPLAIKANLSEAFSGMKVYSQVIDFGLIPINSYVASILTDHLRTVCVESGQSFTFETVMSSPDKLAVLQRAKDAGFRIYLYYVATEDPSINVERVRSRAAKGGHSVPTNKIIDRYYRSLDYLLDAIRLSDRAYIFDNSRESRIWVAEITDGKKVEVVYPYIPARFDNYVLEKLR